MTSTRKLHVIAKVNKKDLNKWGKYHIYTWRDSMALKSQLSPSWYIFIAIVWDWNTDSKIYTEIKGPRISKEILKNSNVGRLPLLDITNY